MLAHGSTGFIKHRPLIQRSASKIYHREGVSRLLISAVHHRLDGWGGWLRSGAARARSHGGAPWPSKMAHRTSSFLKLWWSLSDEACSYGITAPRGNSIRLTLIGGGWQRSPATVRRLDRCLVTVRVASGEASAPRMCSEASSSSFLASRLINCSKQRRKTRIWWLSRFWQVLDLRPKIHTIGGAIYMGF
jgi:hypothetical protein